MRNWDACPNSLARGGTGTHLAGECPSVCPINPLEPSPQAQARQLLWWQKCEACEANHWADEGPCPEHQTEPDNERGHKEKEEK